MNGERPVATVRQILSLVFPFAQGDNTSIVCSKRHQCKEFVCREVDRPPNHLSVRLY
jgi:hypothetical protein